MYVHRPTEEGARECPYENAELEVTEEFVRKRWEIELRAKKRVFFLFPKSRMRKAEFVLGFAVILRAPFDRAGSTGNRPNPTNNDRDMAELPKVN